MENFSNRSSYIFLCVSVFLFIRPVDGHGTMQTLEVKLISFAVWGIFYLGVLAIEWLIYLIVQHTKKKKLIYQANLSWPFITAYQSRRIRIFARKVFTILFTTETTQTQKQTQKNTFTFAFVLV